MIDIRIYYGGSRGIYAQESNAEEERLQARALS